MSMLTVCADPNKIREGHIVAWYCEGCTVMGLVKVKHPVDVWLVMHDVEVQHKEMSPDCKSIGQWPKEKDVQAT